MSEKEGFNLEETERKKDLYGNFEIRLSHETELNDKITKLMDSVLRSDGEVHIYPPRVRKKTTISMNTEHFKFLFEPVDEDNWCLSIGARRTSQSMTHMEDPKMTEEVISKLGKSEQPRKLKEIDLYNEAQDIKRELLERDIDKKADI